MNRILSALAVCLLLFSLSCHAAKYAGEFLALGLGSRAQGMGGSYVSIAEDGFACYWNPAGTYKNIHQVEYAHASNFNQLVAYDALGYARPGSSYGLGLTFLRLSVKDIPYTDQALLDLNGNGIMDPGERLDYDKITSTSDNESALLINYSRPMRPSLTWGVNAKVVYKSVGSNSAWGLGLDLGAIMDMPYRMRLGVNLQDITTTYLAWDTGAREVISPTARIGLSCRPLLFKSTPLTVAAGADVRFENRRSSSNVHLGPVSADLHLGAEYWIKGRLALRAGSDQGRLAAGAGLRLGRFSFDYAYLDHAELKGSTRLSGSIRF